MKMQKPQPGKALGFPSIRKLYNISSVVKHNRLNKFTQAPDSKNNYSTNYYNTDLVGAIKNHHFTDALEILEKSGYTSDVAIFMLAYIQGGVRNA